MHNLSKDEEGIAIELLIDSGASIETATDLKMIFKTPRETNIEKTAVFTTDGTDGLIQYVITASDLNDEGVWRVRGNYNLGAEEKFTSWAEFRVAE